MAIDLFKKEKLLIWSIYSVFIINRRHTYKNYVLDEILKI